MTDCVGPFGFGFPNAKVTFPSRNVFFFFFRPFKVWKKGGGNYVWWDLGNFIGLLNIYWFVGSRSKEKRKKKKKVDWAFDIKINFLGFMYGCWLLGQCLCDYGGNKSLWWKSKESNANWKEIWLLSGWLLV